MLKIGVANLFKGVGQDMMRKGSGEGVVYVWTSESRRPFKDYAVETKDCG